MMKLFDSHCHLDDGSFQNDMDDVIKRMDTAGVAAAMIVGIDGKSSVRAVDIARSRPSFHASVGFHPHDAKSCSEPALESLRKLAEDPSVRAWGEIGLDFNRMFSPREDQEKWMARQIEIAGEMDLPVIFHERDSNGRFLEILQKHWQKGRKGVVHCFSGNAEELKHYIALGLHIGITGILTIKGRGAALRKLAPSIPVDRIVIETDAPYLTPAPEKNHARRNEPAFVKSVLLRLAEVLDMDPERLAAVIWDNTCTLYNFEIGEKR